VVVVVVVIIIIIIIIIQRLETRNTEIQFPEKLMHNLYSSQSTIVVFTSRKVDWVEHVSHIGR
jgi:hypothetical protein